VITSANTHNDVTVAIDTVDSIVIKKKDHHHHPNQSITRNRTYVLIRTYHFKEVEQEIIKRGYIPHIRHRREEIIFRRKHPARRWVVEREQIHGTIIDSGNYLQDMKRRKRELSWSCTISR
jgi:hypothetical protein